MQLNQNQIEQIEKALGFQLYPWIKQRLMGVTNPIEFPDGRHTGLSTYHCLLSCLDYNEPKLIVDYSMLSSIADDRKIYLPHTHGLYVGWEDGLNRKRYHWYLRELRRIYFALKHNTDIQLRDIRFKL